MKKEFLNEKRQRDKEDLVDNIENEIKDEDSLKNKKPKLEEINFEDYKMNTTKINENEINSLNNTNNTNNKNNLDSKDISELTFNYNSINTNIKCKICSKDITKNIKFYCNTCSDFIFCIECFGLSKHPKSHDYHIIDNVNFPFYTEDWSINEEHKLISNISKCGLNNWEEISKQMNNKGQLECESHYYSFYNIDNKSNPFPDENKIILDANKNINKNILSNNEKIYEEKIKFYSANTGNSTAQEDKEKESQNIKRNSRSLCVRKNSRGGGAESLAEIMGVKPLRKEFDNEFMNDCEIEISHLEFDENNKENQKDLDLKMNLLKDYNLILKEREKRKNFIFEKNLLDLRRQNRIESKLSLEEYELLLFMKPFHRFFENSEFFDVLENIVIEQQLKLMLKTLNKLENEKSSKGGKISTLEDIEKFLETDKIISKGRKHNTHEHNKDKEKDKEKEIFYEENLLGNRIERLYEYNKIKKEKKIEEIFDKEEFELVKEMPLARSTFYDIKLKIEEIFAEEKKEKNGNMKEKIEKLLERYSLERQTHSDIFDFYCKKYNDLMTKNEDEIEKEKENKKIKDTKEIKEIKSSINVNINENEEIKSEKSNKSNNKNRYKHKNKKLLENKKNKKNKAMGIKDIKDDKEKSSIKESQKENSDKKKTDENNDNKMDIEIEDKSITIDKNKNKEKENNDNIDDKDNSDNKKEVSLVIDNKDKEDDKNNNKDDDKMDIENIEKDKNEIIESNKMEDKGQIEKEENKDIIIEKTDIKYYKND